MKDLEYTMSENTDCAGVSLGILEILTKKHVISILEFLTKKNEPVRFQEIHNQLNINSRTLTDRLRDLEQHKMIRRKIYEEIPPRVEYEIVDVREYIKNLIIAINNLNLALDKMDVHESVIITS